MKRTAKNKSNLVRFGVALDRGLLERFDTLLRSLHYTNRSKAIADLIRERLVEEDWLKGNKMGVGVITLVYDHHKYQLDNKLIDIQHHHLGLVLSSMHVHLDKNLCLEILAVRGNAVSIKKLAGKLGGLKGVRHTSISFTTTDLDT
ncbi:nickel-responsive transcriptional regulator NikR [Candidatus Sumerlaeota bacterium]|nr:nickel-responsive transcriptional regulator NikR [Candidatus Sumerlaeota bacterium]